MNINLETIQNAGQIITKSTGDFIFREGDFGREMFVVLSGNVNIYLERDQGKIHLAELKRGDFFGEMSLLEDMPRSGTAVAEEPTELVALGEASFQQLMTSHHEFTWKVLKGLSRRIRNQNESLANQVSKDLHEVAQKLNQNIASIADAIQDISQSADEIEDNGKELSHYIREIETISLEIKKSLNFIHDVALKTKIFGLNASIEAARSGEHGLGIAVIAQEIRKLSELSQSNAETISQLTSQIDIKISEVTKASENSARKSQTQAGATSEAVLSIQEVTGLTQRLVDIAGAL